MINKKTEEFFLDCLTLENGKNMLSRNVGKLLTTYAAQHPRTAKASAYRRKVLKSFIVLLFFRILHNVGLEPRCAHLGYKIVQTIERHQFL